MQYDLHASNFTLFTSDGVKANLSHSKLKGGRALRLDYEFKGAGHTLIRVPVSLRLTANYVFRFSVKGTAPANTLEFKCVDPTGENVWWVNRPGFKVSQDWQELVNKKRHFTYAWGPLNQPLVDVGFLELTVSASSGGKGTIYFADLSFADLAGDHKSSSDALGERITISASSARATVGAIVTDGRVSQELTHPGWRSSAAERQYLHLDFGRLREFDGLTVDFGEQYAVDYEVQITAGKSKKCWRTIDTINGGAGKKQFHCLPESEATALRLVFHRSRGGCGYEVKAISVKPVGFAATTSSFFAAIAEELPRGFAPRYFQKEQSFWTVVGVSGGREKAIINEEGMIEPALQSPALEPFIYADGKLHSWADGSHSQSLVDGYLALPMVRRQHLNLGLDLTVETLAQGGQNNSTLYARYTVKNTGSQSKSGSLFVALRHYQVNPPWQFLNTPGGFTPVNQLSVDHFGLEVNGSQDGLSDKNGQNRLKIIALDRADGFKATCLARGEIVEHLAQGSLPAVFGDGCQEAGNGKATVEDSRGFCSGALEKQFTLVAGQSLSFALAVPYTTESKVKSFARARAQAIAYWKKTLRSVDIDLPAHPELVNTIKSQLAYILINRDGQALQPGSRCYRRTWIRDGSLTSEALLQLGRQAEVRRFIDWFAKFQYPDGKVPCCVDKRGADPTPEHDSHGEFIYLVVEYYRYSKDKKFLRRLFPQLVKAVEYIDGLRSQRLTDAYKSAENRHLYGLLPESISHEGYSAKPAHSYWDDLFALKGLGDALYAASELGAEQAQAGQKIATIYDAFKVDLVASMKASMVKWGINFIPGAADRGDFDATSTTIALDPCDLSQELSSELASTFEAYWQFFTRRRDGALDWKDYTPYEWRVVGTLARLGQIDRAHQALTFFMKDRRPRGWNHWAEVVFKDPLTPRFIGDAPHGWVGSDFLRAVRTLFAYEKPGALVVGSGLPTSWLRAGLSIANLATEFGQLSLSVQHDGKSITYRLTGDITVPLQVMVPVNAGHEDDKRRCIVVQNLPATVTVDLD